MRVRCKRSWRRSSGAAGGLQLEDFITELEARASLNEHDRVRT